MKREIKFKGLRTDGKGWVYGSLATMENLLQYGNSDTSSNVHIIESKDLEIRAFKKGCEVWMDNGLIQVHTESVGQFTGLKDLKGNDIFEGDVILSSFKIRQKETKEERLIEDKIIVEWKHQEEDYEQSHFYGYDVRDGRDVKYNNVYWDCLEMKYEVIGNIHEHPELLNTNP